MAFEPVYEKVLYNTKGKEFNDRIKTECKADVDSEEVKRVINLSTALQITGSERSGDKVKYFGRINYFVCYENGEGEICKKECATDFDGEITVQEVDRAQRVEVDASVDKTEVNLSGIKMTLSAYVVINVYLSGSEEVSALVGGSNIITDSQEITIEKSMGVRETSYPIEEQFDINSEIKEVLNHSARAAITSVQCGVGCIIADGEVYLSLVMLKSGEGTEIIKEEKTFPFRAEIDCEEAMPANFATASVNIKSFKTDISVSEDKNLSSAQVSVLLALKGEAFENKTASVAVDAFSLTDDVTFSKKECCVESGCEVRSVSANVSGTSNIETVPEGAVVAAVTGEKVEIVSAEALQEGVKITGVLSATLLLSDSDGRLLSRKAEIPFEQTVDASIECGGRFKIKSVAHSSFATIKSPEEAELSATVVFTFYPTKRNEFCVIEEIGSNGTKVTERCAISVYIAREGESLWQLAKRLNVCPSELVENNKDLQFPLSGKERILIYRQK